ncbi:Crp/Fnr family transcriptional regulator [Palleronia sediminis]|uniref:Crp/Fnr family transcriptional regulator n=1 Tax=Palleronia sediminis TaxID=2547833 RepID=A0A4R6A6T8_9RHOB|nr:Crp/Fnr family transcriptional regulator [Palleronia sediminis]TDL79380.1 Crp/Fnr family transcriptional regulator [Palleronia sediminis]
MQDGVDCKDCPLRRLEIFHAFSPSDLAFMREFKIGELRVDPGGPILVEGSRNPQLFTVLAGMGLRYKTLPDGRRQIINFVMPGDFIGLQAAMGGAMGHSVDATTPMTLCVFRRSEFLDVFRDNPSRAYDVTWRVATEEHFLGDALASVGQRSAIERVAWAMVRLHQRTAALGLADDGSIPFPYRQQDLADTLGLSLVHTNKTLAKLRERNLVSWVEGRLHLHDLDTLGRIAVVDPNEEPLRRPLI